MALSAKAQHDKMAQKILARRGAKAKVEVEAKAEFEGWTKKRLKALLDEFDVDYEKKATLPQLVALAIENDLTEDDEA